MNLQPATMMFHKGLQCTLPIYDQDGSHIQEMGVQAVNHGHRVIDMAICHHLVEISPGHPYA
jgi:hypothetical protein